MKKQRRPKRNYSEEFMKEAVSRCNLVGPKQTCDELDISNSVLARWRKKYSDSSIIETKSKDKPSYEELEKENRRLKRELGYIQDINDVLKKSTAIFSNSHLKDFK